MIFHKVAFSKEGNIVLEYESNNGCANVSMYKVYLKLKELFEEYWWLAAIDFIVTGFLAAFFGKRFMTSLVWLIAFLVSCFLIGGISFIIMFKTGGLAHSGLMWGVIIGTVILSCLCGWGCSKL